MSLKDYLKRFGIENVELAKHESSSAYINRIAREYSIYILDDRAIPSMTDGLKQSQRIAMWLIRNRTKPIKTMGLAGEMISSNLYVHGDASAADAISRLAAPYLNNHALIQGLGQFGTRIAPVEGIGAPRYTEVKKADFADKHFYTDLDIIPMQENYDGSTLMPATFLPILPLVLLNGVKGMARGWATNILPRSFKDLQDATKEYLKYGKVKNPLLPHYDKYDVEIRDLGESKYAVTGKLEIRNTSTVMVHELPPSLSLDAFRNHLADLEDNKKIEGFTDYTTEHISIEIKMKRANLAQHDESSLIEMLKLRTTLTENLVVLDPMTERVKHYTSAQKLVEDFVEWRLNWYKTRFEYLLKREQERSIFYLSMLACFQGDNPVANRISQIESKSDMKTQIETALQEQDVPVDHDVIEKLAVLPVYRWTKEGYQDCLSNLEDCLEKIEHYETMIEDPERRRKLYVEENGK